MTKNKLMVARVEGAGWLDRVRKGDWGVQASRYGMTKSWEKKAQHGEGSQWYYNSIVW